MTTVRVACADDGSELAKVYAPFVTDTVISFETEPPSAASMSGRVAKILQSYPWLVSEEGGEILGYAYASQHQERAAYRWSVDTTVYVRPEAQRSGVASGLYKLLLQILEGQGFRSAFAGITLPNEASVGFHQALGFEKLGVYQKVGFKLGAWRDVGWWQMFLGEGDGAPDEVVPFATFRDTHAFRLLLPD